jgi:hypothetical protein
LLRSIFEILLKKWSSEIFLFSKTMFQICFWKPKSDLKDKVTTHVEISLHRRNPAPSSFKAEFTLTYMNGFFFFLMYKTHKKKFIYFLGRDSCNGDSGGPIAYREFSDDPWYQVGLVSYGTSKCGQGEPGVYTKIEGYLDWIAKHLEP